MRDMTWEEIAQVARREQAAGAYYLYIRPETVLRLIAELRAGEQNMRAMAEQAAEAITQAATPRARYADL